MSGLYLGELLATAISKSLIKFFILKIHVQLYCVFTSGSTLYLNHSSGQGIVFTFCELYCRINQFQFSIFWHPGNNRF